MEARIYRAATPVVLTFIFTVYSSTAVQSAGYRTTNFTVDAPTPQLAKEIGDSAERWRAELAQEWLGKQLPNWSKPCPIKAKVASNLGAGGATSFVFDQNEVFGWRMTIQGSRERILDSVLPHEVTHTIFASHFRRPLPRWADEGACTTVEHRSEISKQENMLIEFLKTRRGIPFSNMFAMKEYPQDVLPLYAQGHSLSQFLIYQRGKREFMEFLADGMEDENWPQAIQQRYGYNNLLVLQNSWMDWIRQGRPQLQLAADIAQVAATNVSAVAPPSDWQSSGTVVRGQDPAPKSPIQLASASVYAAADYPSSESTSPPSTPSASPEPATPDGPTSEQLWPAENSEVSATPLASVYNSSRSTGTVRR
ncbi:MAG: hypothetical protein GXP26_17250 [Planctomycetes bacterium]|nr:hypothetical protein [Planctomycetota bacterium]